MAPSKRQKGSIGAQSTLSFSRSRPQPSQAAHAGKVTKPNAAATSKPDSVKAEKLEQASQKPPVVDEIVLEQAPAAEDEPEEEEEEEDAHEVAARKITDKQIRAYWTDKEKSRMAPRVHQGNLGLHEKCLREWDMQTRFGPSIGIQRLRRWKRARDLGMKPPMEVLAVLLKEEARAPGKERAQTSILDELILSSKVAGEATVA